MCIVSWCTYSITGRDACQRGCLIASFIHCLRKTCLTVSVVYLSISFYFLCYWVSICLYLSLSVFICLYLSLSVFICLYLSLSVFICLYLSLSVFICLYLSLSVFICLSLPPLVSLCLHLSLSVSICLYLFSLSLSASITFSFPLSLPLSLSLYPTVSLSLSLSLCLPLSSFVSKRELNHVTPKTKISNIKDNKHQRAYHKDILRKQTKWNKESYTKDAPTKRHLRGCAFLI